MRSAYNVHPEVGCFYLSTNLRRKAGLALAFIAVGSIAGASGVIVQMAGHEKDFGNLLAPRQGHGRRGEIVDRRYQVDRLGGMLPTGRIERLPLA
jgi:hypothetical protein